MDLWPQLGTWVLVLVAALLVLGALWCLQSEPGCQKGGETRVIVISDPPPSVAPAPMLDSLAIQFPCAADSSSDDGWEKSSPNGSRSRMIRAVHRARNRPTGPRVYR